MRRRILQPARRQKSRASFSSRKSKAVVFLLFDWPQLVRVGNGLAVNETKRLVGSFDAHAVTKLRGQIGSEKVGRLQDMTVRINDSKSISHG